MTDTSFQTSTTLSMLGSLDPYWESQLLMEYSKNLFTCKVIDCQVMDKRYNVVDVFTYSHDHIYLTRDSKLKEKLLNAAYEIFVSKSTGFIRTYHTILEGFMWEYFEEERHYHMSKCIDYLEGEEKHNSWEELS